MTARMLRWLSVLVVIVAVAALAFVYGIGAVVGLVVAALLLFLLWWLPKWQVQQSRADLGENAPAMAENEFRKTLVQTVGGVLLVGGLVITWKEVEVARQQSGLAMEMAQEQLSLARFTAITERFATAVEQLDGSSTIVRAGAAYSLGRIARDSPGDHEVVLQVLAAFLRGREISAEEDWTETPSDVQAAIASLGGPVPYEDTSPEFWIDLTEVDLQMAKLVRMDFRGFFFDEALLRSAFVLLSDFSNASLGDVDFSEATLAGVNLEGAFLDGTSFERSTLVGVNLRNAEVTSDFLLDMKTLFGSNMHGLDLSDSPIDLEGDRLLAEACGDETTLLPEGVKQPSSWPCTHPFPLSDDEVDKLFGEYLQRVESEDVK